MEVADGVRAHDLHRMPERGADAGDMAQPVELVVGIGDAQGAAVVEGDRLAGLRLDALVEIERVARHAAEPVAGHGVRDLSGRVPSRAGGELSLFDEHTVRPSFAGEVTGERATEDASADDHDARVGGQRSIPAGGTRSAERYTDRQCGAITRPMRRPAAPPRLEAGNRLPDSGDCGRALAAPIFRSACRGPQSLRRVQSHTEMSLNGRG